MSVLVLTLAAGVILAGPGPGESPIEAAARRLSQAAQSSGASAGEAGQAVATLRRLVEAGLPVDHARQVVTAAIAAKHRGPDIAAIARGVEEAHARGASSHELVNLTEDLTRSGVDTPGLLTAIDAVGRLAEDGYTDAETRRGVALTVIHNVREGVRGRELAEAVHEEARDAKEESGGAPAGTGPASGGSGRGRSEEARDKDKDKNTDVRDELRRNPPPGLPEGKGPAGVPERVRDDKGKPDDKDDKGKPDNPGKKK